MSWRNLNIPITRKLTKFSHNILLYLQGGQRKKEDSQKEKAEKCAQHKWEQLKKKNLKLRCKKIFLKYKYVKIIKEDLNTVQTLLDDGNENCKWQSN